MMKKKNKEKRRISVTLTSQSKMSLKGDGWKSDGRMGRAGGCPNWRQWFMHFKHVDLIETYYL